VSLLSRLDARNKRQAAELAALSQARDLTGPEMAKRIAQAIREAAPRCPYEIHPPGCPACTKARQAEESARVAEETGGVAT
jgi:hypothetical protein